MLAKRRFKAGEHDLVWDGTDDNGRPVARGVYFTQVKYKDSAFNEAKKLTVLK
jgi:flagellar hook assembly protein FlgD